MQVGVISINHKKAPVEIREIAVFTDKKKIEAIDGLLELDIEEASILSTCNRSEIYIAAKDINKGLNQVKAFLIDYFKVKELKHYLVISANEKAIEHLYKVASGLDSIVIGEDQILGQVKDALEFSMELGSSKKFLNKLFRDATTFAKKMKHTYKISEKPLSIPYIGFLFVKEKLGHIKDKKIFIIGTGEMGALVLKHLKTNGVEDISVCSRTKRECKKDPVDPIFDTVQWIPYEERYSHIQEIDIIFSATSSPHTILRYEKYPKITHKQIIMDMAMPRDIDPKIETLEYVDVYNIDDLNEISQNNQASRETMALKIEAELMNAVECTSQWIKLTKMDPIIQSLQSLQQEVARDTLDMIDHKLDLNKKEKILIEKLIHTSLKRMVRTPIKALKQLNEEDEIKAYKEMLHKLYDI
ncbi:glutamyl-tRNA reductase [Natranaerovirga hydrolytica]|uniref:Glutamyl-tRNA reductase n=1 Tax=Natranaerovirga hydrolytica TaxID=680378 RepID=A0A4R1MKW4_9FIRM|nr:glutamyl-tRNA reductase [Natranaerovirga hydrolytica]TCK92472.1 glutamyl-tRNA reductase [Natranaerovirga hydrolytica]